MRLKAFAAVMIVFVASCVSVAQEARRSQDPVNPSASPEARALLKYLYSISGKYTLSGQHNYPYTISRWTDRSYTFTGKYPAIYGQDFGFQGGEDKDSTFARPALIEEIKRQYRNGAIPTLTWHAVRPTSDEPVTFRENIQSDLTDFEWNELITPGTALNSRWRDQIDVIAGYLKQLRDARVPVLFRPYHEINGNWFWWTGRPGKNGSAELYRQLYNQYVNHHKLDNLIWVWNVNAPSVNAGPVEQYYPGHDVVDVLSMDNYGEFKPEYYTSMKTLAEGKPVALGEVGILPTAAVLQQQPWTWFMVWSEWVETANPLELLQSVYTAPNTVNRDDPRLTPAMTAMRKASEEPKPHPVTPDATVEAKALLAQLYSVAGKNVLSGQENDAAAPAAASEHVVKIAAKMPSIYAADLGMSKPGADPAAARKAIADEAIRQHKSKAVVSLSWRPVRPTDDAVAPQAINTPLTEFEWNELLTPGTRLYQRWTAQVDAVAATLKELQGAGVPVLWRPYPEPNSKKFWWAGRKGIHGSAALYRQLFNRLTKEQGLKNLIWVWEADFPGYGPDDFPHPDYFPGLLYVDALSLEDPNFGYNVRDAGISVFSIGKPIGIRFSGSMPKPDVLETRWSWILLSPDTVGLPENAESVRQLYSSPRLQSRAPQTPAAP